MIRFAVISLLCLFCLSANELPASAELSLGERRLMAALRQIGHEVLLQAGDSTSTVLPIEKINGRYRMRFDATFGFDPECIIASAFEAFSDIGLTDHFLVETEKCTSLELVHSFEYRPGLTPDAAACRGRTQIEGCYEIFVTIFEDVSQNRQLHTDTTPLRKKGIGTIWLIGLALGVAGIGIYFFWPKKQPPAPPITTDRIGAYQFDATRMELIHDDARIALSGKETALLTLLHQSMNTTIDRDRLLKEVWGDEGDYIGRTLDVFISKLRKKLAQDENVKIINIRGVGYKLVVG